MKKYSYKDTVFELSEENKSNSRTLYVTHYASGHYAGSIQATGNGYHYFVTSGGRPSDAGESGNTSSVQEAIEEVCDSLLKLRVEAEIKADQNWEKAQDFLKGLPDKT